MTEEAYILYIEDERPTIRLVCEMLKLVGYEAIGVTSGEQGLALMRERKPILLLLDLMMPGMSGAEVYLTLQNDQDLVDIPVIVISAKVPKQGRTIVEGLSPVADYVTKPFDLHRLIRSIERHIK